MGRSRQALIKGLHIVCSRKSGKPVRWYVYAWRGGPLVIKSEGPTQPDFSPEILKAIAAAHEQRNAPDEKSLLLLIRLWRKSSAWTSLSANTRKTWGSALDRIEEKWGKVPLSLFNDPRMKSKVVDWRDSRESTPRAADIGVTVLRALLKFGMLKGKVLTNVAADIPSLYASGDRAEIIWTAEDLARFHARAKETNMLPAWYGLLLAVSTGLRREDLVTLTWDHVGEFAIVKKARKTSRGRRRFASIIRLEELDAVLKELAGLSRKEGVNTVLVDEHGASWSPDRLTKSIAKIRDDLGIAHIDEETGKVRKKHLHDARGTYATKLMTSTDLTDQEVAGIMGWSPEEVSRIRHVYVDQTKVVVALGKRIRRSV